MNRPLRLASLLVSGFLAQAPLTAVAADYTVEAGHSHVGFTVRHILTRLPGRFTEFGGRFSFNPQAPGKTAGTFTTKAGSINTDLEKRDAHLRSADFFWAEKYPVLTLVVKGLAPTAVAGTYRAAADLTIRGVTKPVSLEVQYLGAAKTPWGTTVASFEARGTIHRKDFGLTWNTVLESGGVLVGEDVELVLDVEGVEEPAAK